MVELSLVVAHLEIDIIFIDSKLKSCHALSFSYLRLDLEGILHPVEVQLLLDFRTEHIGYLGMADGTAFAASVGRSHCHKASLMEVCRQGNGVVI